MRAANVVQIRQIRSQDFNSLARIFSESILHIGHKCYSPDQVAAWSSFASDTKKFQAWLGRAMTFVAVNESDECLGFGGLEPHGRISSLFVAPDFMRMGIASRLVERLLIEARSRRLEVLTTAASEFSKPVFEKYGFSVTAVEHTQFKGIDFSRYAMQARI